MSNYLFTLTITPVQSFISQAKSTKDLFVGSEILSSLIGKALEEFEKSGIKIIPQDNKFLSNKFVGKLENKTKQNVEDLGNNLENLINKEFINKIFKETCKYNSAFKNFFKVFWVAIELEDDYKKSYQKLEQNLGAVKNLRIFEQDKQEEGNQKCSLCGERNIEKDEKLCLICLTKRECKIQGSDNDSYPSLAKIALLDWLNNTNTEEIQGYRNIFTKNEFDEELLFKDNLTESYFKKNNIKINKLQEAKLFLDTLDTSTQKKYYAIIQFDIDDMGKKLSSLDEEGQKELSKALGKFAQKAKNILNSQYNDTKCTIYAGGDDFLGFVNLEYLFEVIEEIKKSFIDKVKTLFPDLTYSTSIIIAHYKSPLNKVLKYSRITLENAKNKFKVAPKAFKTPKNTMSITYITKSNNISTTYFYRDRIEIFSLLVNLLKDKNSPILSPKFIFNLEHEFRKLSLDTIDDISEIDMFIDMINIELKRLIKRASSDFDKEINDKKRELKELYLGLVEFSYDNWSDKDRMFDFENYVQFLKIANAINGEK